MVRRSRALVGWRDERYGRPRAPSRRRRAGRPARRRRGGGVPAAAVRPRRRRDRLHRPHRGLRGCLRGNRAAPGAPAAGRSVGAAQPALPDRPLRRHRSPRQQHRRAHRGRPADRTTTADGAAGDHGPFASAAGAGTGAPRRRRAWTVPGGTVLIGRGAAGRWEAAVEVDPGAGAGGWAGPCASPRGTWSPRQRRSGRRSRPATRPACAPSWPPGSSRWARRPCSCRTDGGRPACGSVSGHGNRPGEHDPHGLAAVLGRGDLEPPARFRDEVTDDHHAPAVVLLDGRGQPLRPARVAVGDADVQLLARIPAGRRR